MAEIDELEQNEALEFDDDVLPELPDDDLLGPAGQKRPWLYIGIGVVAVALVLVVVLKLTMGGRKNDTGLIEIPIEITEAPDVGVSEKDFVERADMIVSTEPPKPVGMPERVIENRRDVAFDPDRPTVRRPKPKPIAASAPPKRPAAASTAPKGAWYAQVGSYNTRASAESGQRRLQSAHGSLFSGRNFVILAAEVKGETKYRLRIAGFNSGGDANNFCKNIRANGVADCYATK
jgi:cell division septation protein DedD